jgi:flagellar hook-associated protein 2
MANVADSTSSSLSSTILGSLGSLSGGTSTVGANNLNVSTLVSQLVAAERAPRQNALLSQQQAATTEISALGQLKSALAQFQTAAQALSAPGAFNSNKASSSNSNLLTASAGTTSGTGSYQIKVLALAQAEQLASPAIPGTGDPTVGTGSLIIGQGSNSFTVNIDSTNDTLSGIAAAINGATGNTGVQATILNEANGQHLLLTASNTGAASAITVTGSGSLTQFNYNATTKSMTELQQPTDAHIQIGTFDRYSASNTITDAITGVTLNLVAADPNTTVNIGVTTDTSGISGLVSKFVSAYNSLQQTISSLDSYDASSRTAGPLLGDAALQAIETMLRKDLSDSVATASGSFNSLSSIGVTKLADGTLAFDAGKLSTALAQNPDSVAQIFASGDGVATKLNTDINSALSSDGAISSRTTVLQQTLTDIQDKASELDEQMAQVQANYTAQFTALETLLAQLQTTSNYLTQQFTAMQNAQKNA